MSTRPRLHLEPSECERLVVVAPGAWDRLLGDTLTDYYPDWSVARCRTYLLGVFEAARQETRAILAGIEPGSARLGAAIAGLREAAGPHAKLILWCTPEQEPIARQAVERGADDYLIYPLDRDELDAALGYARPPFGLRDRHTTEPVASMTELAHVTDVVSALSARPMALIQKIAALLRSALPARGVTVIVEGAVATAGDPVTKPVLTAPLKDGDTVLGQITVGDPLDDAFTPADVEKLTRYAELTAQVLAAAAERRHLRELSLTDPCTGLPNRRHFLDRLDAILAQAALDRFPVTVLLFDVDDFKAYNDTYGHDAGDAILRATGELFHQHCREQDVVARYGGDEFAVVFWDPEGPRSPGSRHPDCALSVLTRVQQALLEQEFPLLGPTGRGSLTISGGLATYPWDAAHRDDLLKRADDALLAAKRAGKNRIFLIGRNTAGRE